MLFIAAAISVVVCFINVGHIDQQVGGELVKYYQFDSFTLQKLDSNITSILMPLRRTCNGRFL